MTQTIRFRDDSCPLDRARIARLEWAVRGLAAQIEPEPCECERCGREDVLLNPDDHDGALCPACFIHALRCDICDGAGEIEWKDRRVPCPRCEGDYTANAMEFLDGDDGECIDGSMALLLNVAVELCRLKAWTVIEVPERTRDRRWFDREDWIRSEMEQIEEDAELERAR